MVPFEARNNRPQPQLTPLDKAGDPQNKSEFVGTYFDTLKSHTHALLGLTAVEFSTNADGLSSLLADVGQIRAQRQKQFEQTGYIPSIAGGSPKRIELPVDEIVVAYHNHERVEDIARRYKVNASSIYNRLHEVGLPTRGSRDKPSSAPNRQIESENLRRAEEHYKQWLRNNHPELTEEVIEQSIQMWMETDPLRGTISLMDKLDEIIRQKHPDWEWPRWFERKMGG